MSTTESGLHMREIIDGILEKHPSGSCWYCDWVRKIEEMYR